MPDEFTHPPLILGLHKIRLGGWWDHTNVQPERLTGILKSLVEGGYSFVDLESAVAHPQPKQIAVTIDDGYAHLSDSLPPICEQFGLQPHIFIPSEFIGRPNGWDYTSLLRSECHLNEQQIVELLQVGVKIGSHGLSHRQLTRMSASEISTEINESKRKLEAITGKCITAISYPFGRLNRLVMETASEAGYSLGLGTSWPNVEQSRLALGRILIYGYDTPFSVAHKLDGVFASIERTKQEIATYLSGGTAWFQGESG